MRAKKLTRFYDALIRFRASYEIFNGQVPSQPELSRRSRREAEIGSAQL